MRAERLHAEAVQRRPHVEQLVERLLAAAAALATTTALTAATAALAAATAALAAAAAATAASATAAATAATAATAAATTAHAQRRIVTLGWPQGVAFGWSQVRKASGR